MDNANETKSDRWVDDRMGMLDPSGEWAPDSRRALARLRARDGAVAAGRRRWVWAAAAASVACLTLVVFPAPRAVAQRLWDSLLLARVDVIRVNFDDIPDDLRSLRAELVSGRAKQESVRDRAEAQQKVGFQPNLPGSGVLDGSPRLSVLTPMAFRLALSAQELQQGLERAGVSDLTVPKEWDGTTLGVQISPIVMAEYRDITLMQCRPFTLVTPPGFRMAQFAEIAFRIIGLERREARRLSEKFAANPSWFLGIPPDEQVDIREVSLRSGSGMLVEDFDDNGQSERVAVIWSTPDRIYALSGKMTRQLAITVANSVP